MRDKENGRGISAWFYLAVVATLFFSGFGQMPLFKRYYLADIPGMAWSADFYITHVMHYLGAVFLLVILAYVPAARGDLGAGDKSRVRARAVVLGLLVLSGAVLVLKNLPGWDLPPALIVAANLAHIAGAMLFLVVGLYFVLRRPAKAGEKA
ncbi:MAG: FeS-binding protein [Pseudomonadota bacterium]